jgi:hypothetical protein
MYFEIPKPDFTAYRLSSSANGWGILGMTGAEKLRHVFEGLPAVPPHRLRDFEEVAVLEVVDRVVVGHRVANPATKNGASGTAARRGRRVCVKGPLSVNSWNWRRRSGGSETQ